MIKFVGYERPQMLKCGEQGRRGTERVKRGPGKNPRSKESKDEVWSRAVGTANALNDHDEDFW